MSDTKTFDNVTEEIFACVKEKSSKDHGTVYDPPNGNKGTATTKTVVGKVVLGYDLNTDTNEIKYTIVDKPVLAPEHEIWKGIEGAINSCRSS